MQTLSKQFLGIVLHSEDEKKTQKGLGGIAPMPVCLQLGGQLSFACGSTQ